MIKLFDLQPASADEDTHNYRTGAEAGDRLLDIVETWCDGLPSGEGQRVADIRGLVDQLRHDLRRKPRVVLLGEFNSGKTTLASLLTGSRALETNVLSNTRVPVVVQRLGDNPDRLMRPVRLSTLGGAGLRPTFSPPENLEHTTTMALGRLLDAVTLIDTPGLSDPSFESSAASRIAAISDLAIWCSPATQAWKASERKSWDSFARRPRSRSLLVLTGIDMLSPEDRVRVVARVAAETEPRFSAIFPMATLAAQRSLDLDTGQVADGLLWEQSGGAALQQAIETVAFAVMRQRSERAVRWAERLLRLVSEPEPRQVRRAWSIWPGFAARAENRRTRAEIEAIVNLRRRLRDLVAETRAKPRSVTALPDLAQTMSRLPCPSATARLDNFGLPPFEPVSLDMPIGLEGVLTNVHQLDSAPPLTVDPPLAADGQTAHRAPQLWTF